MCPGLPKVSGFEAGSASALMVSALSCADTPVVQPSSLSTVMVNGVPSTEVLSCTWWGRSSSLQRSRVIGAQSTPRACLSMKLTLSAVIFSAAIIRSPSFSLSSSSTTITNSPCLKSLTASSIVLSFIFPVMSYTLFIIYSDNLFLPSGQFFCLWNDPSTGIAYGAQILVEPEPEAEHPDIEEESYGQQQSCHDVHPLLAEGSGM